jgi:hypothetical protein
MNMPCRTPLMLAKAFSEMLSGSGFPVSSTKGTGFPGLHSHNTNRRMSTQANSIETATNMIRFAFRIKDEVEGLFILPAPIEGPGFALRHPDAQRAAP